MKIGDSVKWSGVAMQHDRDRWLSLQGRAHLPEGRAAKAEYDSRRHWVGVVAEINDRYVVVSNPDGSHTHTSAHSLVIAE